jgi:TatD DNase family protein
MKRYGDFKVGIGGVITFKNARLADTVKEIPLCDILLETDAPYLTPTPFRGTRNESAYLSYVITKIADTQQVTEEEVRAATTKNAEAMFGN